jgi:isochorismate synthase
MVRTDIESKCFILSALRSDDLWNAALRMGFPAALWKLPYNNEIKLLVSTSGALKKLQPDLEKLSAGFMLSKFDWQNEEDVLFMTGDIIISFSDQGAPESIDTNNLGEEHPVFQKMIAIAEELNAQKNKSTDTAKHPAPAFADDPDARSRFERTVEMAVAAIKQRQFNKVVLSRTKELSYTKAFQPVNAFYKLTKAYPHAFVSLVNLPEEKELWLGASPEALIQQQANGIFNTMSLAGTQTATNGAGSLIPRYDIRWGQKEIEEQALVSRYIVECFKKIRLREYLETGPKTALAGNLYHLRTDFEVDTHAVNFPELGSVMLRLLHPTSAVCGVPKIPSLEFIKSIEGYDRSYYSGFLGPVQVDGDTGLFVNLRTVRLKNNIATFFAGAGITEDSVPALEWEETELKCDTLLQVIAKDF